MNGAFRHEEIVEQQLMAMAVSRFDIQVRSAEGRVVNEHSELFLAQVKDILEWLHEFNEHGDVVLVRPHGEHGLSLLTGMNSKQVEAAHAAGYEPAVLIEYAPDCFQLWLMHDRKLTAPHAERVNNHLAELLGADTVSSKWNGYGYLAAFLRHGGPEPYRVQLVGHDGVVFSRSTELNNRLAAVD